MANVVPSRVIQDNRGFTIVVWGVVALGAAIVALLLVASGHGTSSLWVAGLAALPVGPIVGLYVWLDRYEPEPRRLMVAALAWGAFAATGVALIAQAVASLSPGVTDGTLLSVVAPITEEATKGVFLLLLLWWRRHELDGILDGIVYAGLVGVGFAFVENVLYLTAAYLGGEGFGAGGSETLTGVFIVRCLLSPFAHPLFVTFTGIGVGLAVTSRSGVRRVLAPVIGYLLAVATHAVWNTATTLGPERFFLVYLSLMAPALIMMMALAVWVRRSERLLLSRALTDAAQRGLLPASEITWLVDLRARRAVRRRALAVGGRGAERAMAEYQQAAIELGFLHHRYLRGTAPADFAARGQQFVNRMYTLRAAAQFPQGEG